MICFLHVRKAQQRPGCGTSEVSLIFPPRQSLCVHALCISLFLLRKCVLFPFGGGNTCREEATFYSHGFPESEVTTRCLKHKPISSV